MTLYVYLEKHDAEKNQHRFYRLSVQPNLFGTYSLIKEYGRVGRNLHTRIAFHDRLEEAQIAFTRTKQAKLQRGYRRG